MNLSEESEALRPLARAIGNYILPELKEHISSLLPRCTSAEQRPKTQKEACAFLSVTRQTLNNYEREGSITPIRKTPGGKPLYPLSELMKMLPIIKRKKCVAD